MRHAQRGQRTGTVRKLAAEDGYVKESGEAPAQILTAQH